MDEPKAYQWAFDGSPADVNPHGFMFSVGIYQWIPKTSGKGLKKSKTIRVQGYVMEAARAFEKAAELCKLFNEKDVRAQKPPKWLQKQYSVPKPANLVLEPLDQWAKKLGQPSEPGVYLERFSNDLPGNKVRAVRLKVMERKLIPQGFIKAEGGTYVREQNDQIHLIDFQPNRWGHDYTINIGFHYTFMPGFWRAALGRIREFRELDCAIHDRLHHIVMGRDIWFKYGHDVTTLEAVFEKNANTCLSVFDEQSDRWIDPRCWLDDSFADIKKWRVESILLFQCCIALHLKMQSKAEQLLTELRKTFLHPAEQHAEHYRRDFNRILGQVTGDRKFRI